MLRRVLAAALAGAAALALGGCAAAAPRPAPSRTAPVVAAVQAPGRPVTLLDAAAPATRAIGASGALFASSPGVVLAPAAAAADDRRGAADAVRLHVPLLLVDPTAAGERAVRTETARLRARWAQVVGAVPAAARQGVHRVANPAPVPRPRSSTAIVLLDGADAAPAATARAAGATVVPMSGGDVPSSAAAVRALAEHPTAPAVLVGAGFAHAASPDWAVASARTGFALPGGGQRPLPGHRFVALYGVPGVPVLGALGDQGVVASIARVRALAAQYRPLSSEPVVPTLEIIATVAAGSPGADHDYSNELDPASLAPWVTAARRAGVEVVLDLQPGRATFPEQVTHYAALLEQPNVGLALDPEWRLGPHQLPLRQIGSVSADEVNRTSAWLARLVVAHHLPPKPFVLHEFRTAMLPDRSRIALRPQLTTLIHVDGQGGQPDKQATWRAVREGAPTGVGWGWKNFLHKDHPMLTPAQTMHDVHPAPDLITYQ